MSPPLSRRNLPKKPTPDDILNVFLEYLSSTNTQPYDHQEEAILELFAGNNVILNSPTGSGKSLVALVLQFKSLCHVLGSENVRPPLSPFPVPPMTPPAKSKFLSDRTLSLFIVRGRPRIGFGSGSDIFVTSRYLSIDGALISCTAF